jgi:hypothetical protein
MIDKNKKYRTRDGREVRIYATDGDNNKLIHGAIWSDGWQFKLWYADGFYNGDAESRIDLIEVRPRHKRTVWVNVYRDDWDAYTAASKEDADENACDDRIACVRIDFDFEDGEGL